MKISWTVKARGYKLIEGIYSLPRTIILCLAGTTILSGCFQHYFSSQTQSHIDEATIKNLLAQNKYFIIHAQDRIAGIQNVSVSTDTLEGNVVLLPPEHSRYTNVHEHSNKNVVSRKDEKSALAEVHLYTGARIDSQATRLYLPLASINQMDVYKSNPGAAKANRVVSWVGIVVGAAFAALIVVMIGSGGIPE